MRTACLVLVGLVVLAPAAADPLVALQALAQPGYGPVVLPLDTGWLPDTEDPEEMRAFLREHSHGCPYHADDGVLRLDESGQPEQRTAWCAPSLTRRVDGDAEWPDMTVTISAMLAQLEPAQLDALAGGALLPLGALSPAAATMARAMFPHLGDRRFQTYLPPGGDRISRTEAERRNGVALSDAAWAERQASQDEFRLRHAHWAYVPSEPALRLSVHGQAVLHDAEGRPLFRPLTIFGTSPADSSASYAEQANGSLTAAGDDGGRLRNLVFNLLDPERTGPALVTIPRSDAYTLAELCGLLSAHGPCTVADEFAGERLFVSAGDYDVINLRCLIQISSGLLFTVLDDRSLRLDRHPAVAPRGAVAMPAGVWSALTARTAPDSPFTAADLVAADGADRVAPFAELTAEQQAYLLIHAEPTTGSLPTPQQAFLGGQPTANARAAAGTVSFRLELRLEGHAVYQVGAPGEAASYFAEVRWRADLNAAKLRAAGLL